MTAFDIMFYLFAIITVVSAFVTALSKNIVYAAFSLMFTFFGVAGMYVLLNADFLAVTQIMVYVGGILVLLIFGVMLTNRVINVDIRAGSTKRWPIAIICLGLFASLFSLMRSAPWLSIHDAPWSTSPWATDAFKGILGTLHAAPGEPAGAGSSGTAQEIGKLLLTDFLLPFEIVSIVLLVALIGAAMIARKEPTPKELADMDLANEAKA